MSEKVAVIYYSATGNTEAMAEAVSIGAKSVVEDVLLHQWLMWIPRQSEKNTPILFWGVLPGALKS